MNFDYSKIIARLQSSLTDTQTQAVLEILVTTQLTTVLEKVPLGIVRFAESWNDFNTLHANLASGICIPPFEEYRHYGYPHLRVRAITRADRIPLGEEALRLGQSEAVAVVTTPTEWMQCVLIHEIGHHLIFERAAQLVALIKSAFEQSQNPITQLASLNWEEYFCENLSAYVFYANQLQKYDQIGYNAVRQALEVLRGES